MCLYPLNIINPTKRISLYQAQQMRMQVRCNKCAECLQAIRSEWYFRSYYHSKATLINGGYIMMDCLTYRPKDVPHISDFIDNNKYGLRNFMCFNFKHVRDFIKLLRVRLARQGYKNKKAFDYFVTSEYGTSENGTHRPHYHILLFINDKRINPYWLSLLISELWPYGRTDGLKYHPKLYVDNHIYGYNNNDDIQAVTAVTNYVSKYVTKDSTYQSTIDKRLSVIRGRVTADEYNDLYRHISMFHRQSQGFGLDYLNIITTAEYEKMKATTEMEMPDTKYIRRIIKLPMYYIRKLYYNQGKEVIYVSPILKEQGDKIIRKYWYLNDYGKEWRKQYLKKSIDDLTDNLYDTTLNMQDDEKYILTKLLDGRTLRDYAVYKLLFQGRLKNGFDVVCEDSMINHIVEYDTPYIDDNYLYRYKPNGPLFKDSDIVTNKNLDFMVYQYENSPLFRSYSKHEKGHEIHQLGDYIPICDFVKDNTYNQDTYSYFNYFDTISELFGYVTKRIKSNVQPTFDKIEQLKQRYKSMRKEVF